MALALVGAADAGTKHRRSKRHTVHHSGRSKSQLVGALQSIKSKKQKVRAQLRETKHQAHVVKRDIQVVDAQLDDVKARLSTTRRRLADSRAEQKQVTQQLKDTNLELAATRVQVRARLRHIYMQGHGSGFSAVVGTRSAGDLASRGALLGAIEHKDRELFNHYTELQQEVEEHKRRQDALVARIDGLEQEQQGQKMELAQVREEKGQLLKGLRAKQGELEELLQQFQQDEEEITSQIEAYNRRNGGSSLPAFTGRFSRPVNAPITSGFGMRYHPILHYTRLHAGVDFGASSGTPIHAAADGNVIAVRRMRGYGLVVMIDHGGGISTVYAHTSATYVSTGQHVHRGQTIAAVGMSGLATGPHLHFEVRVNGRPVNPLGRL